jgi:hypothetical protein
VSVTSKPFTRPSIAVNGVVGTCRCGPGVTDPSNDACRLCSTSKASLNFRFSSTSFYHSCCINCCLPRALILRQFHRAPFWRPAGYQQGFSLFRVLSHPSRTFLLSSPMSAPLLEVLISNKLSRPEPLLIFQKILFFLCAAGLVVRTRIAIT